MSAIFLKKNFHFLKQIDYNLSMFSLLHKYIGKKFILAFVAVFFALAGLSLLVDIIEMLRKVADKPNVSFGAVLGISLTKLPFIMSQILPFCVVIATVITFWSMNRNSELIIYRAVGMSAKNFISPLLAIAFVLGVFATTIFNPFTAAMYNKHNRMLEKNGFTSDRTPFLSEDGLWLRENIDGATSVIHTNNITLEDNQLKLKQISIIKIKDDYVFDSRIEAKEAIIKDNFISMPKASVFKPESIPEQIINHKIKTNVSVNQLQENMTSPETVSFWAMPKIIAFFEKSGFASDTYRVYYYSLLANPFLLISFVLAVVPFMLITNTRKSSALIRTTLAIISGFILFFFSKITMAFGASSSIPMIMAVGIPIAITCLCSFAAILHYEDG